MSGCPLVSVVEDRVFVDAVCGELAPNFRPLLTQVVEESGHQLKLLPGTQWQTFGRDRDLDNQFMDTDTGPDNCNQFHGCSKYHKDNGFLFHFWALTEQ